MAIKPATIRQAKLSQMVLVPERRTLDIIAIHGHGGHRILKMMLNPTLGLFNWTGTLLNEIGAVRI